MAFNINDIISTINGKNGLTKSSKFIVRITRNNGSNDQTIPFLCDQTTLPGVQVVTNEYAMHTYDISQKRPVNVNFQDLPLQFYCDNKGDVFNYFHSWINQIATFNNLSDNNRFLLAYPDSYRSTVEVILYDDAQNIVISYKMNEAYPTSIDASPVSWDSSDQLLKLNVTLTFTNWSTEKLDVTTIMQDFDINNYNSSYSIPFSNQSGYSVNPAAFLLSPALQTVQNITNLVNTFRTYLL